MLLRAAILYYCACTVAIRMCMYVCTPLDPTICSSQLGSYPVCVSRGVCVCVQSEMNGDVTAQRRWEAYDKLGTFVIYSITLVLGIQALGLEGEHLFDESRSRA